MYITSRELGECSTYIQFRTCVLQAPSSPANIYLFKVNNRNTRKRCEISSKLTTKTHQCFIVNFEHTSYLFLVFLWFNCNRQMSAGSLLFIKVIFSDEFTSSHNLSIRDSLRSSRSVFRKQSNTYDAVLRNSIIDI